MSKLLEEITTDKIGVSVCLQRLLVIANKTDNKDLANWCMNELNGYESSNQLPAYRKKKSRHIVYSGINGVFQATNQPIGLGFLKEETLKKVEDVGFFEGIVDIQNRRSANEPIYRDLTPLAYEVYKNTEENSDGVGVRCTAIKQIIGSQLYSEVYEAVKIRVINLLCSFEAAGIKIDRVDVASRSKRIAKENRNVYDEIVVNGRTYAFQVKENKLIWSVLVPLIVGIVSAVISGLIVYYLTKGNPA